MIVFYLCFLLSIAPSARATIPSAFHAPTSTSKALIYVHVDRAITQMYMEDNTHKRFVSTIHVLHNT